MGTVIHDCFIFFNENDVLDIRFQELYPVVDEFVIVQANQTFRGNDKPDYFDYERFSPYMDKVKMVTMDLPNGSPWDREFAQRNSLSKHLTDPWGGDMVIISDVDEIPRRTALEGLKPHHHIALEMKRYSYGINMLTPEGTHACKITRWQDLMVTTPQAVRTTPQSQARIIKNAGWEFTSLGTPEQILYKLKSFAHSELDVPELTVDVLRERMHNHQDIAGRDWYHEVVEIDDTWPEAIKNNREYWSKYEW